MLFPGRLERLNHNQIIHYNDHQLRTLCHLQFHSHQVSLRPSPRVCLHRQEQRRQIVAALRGKQQREQLEKMIRGYILNRREMTNLFVLIDSRHAPMKIDLDFFNWLGENGVPFAIVFTKLDKLGNDAGRRNVERYCAKLLETWEELPPIFTTSSEDGRGRDQLLDSIEQLNRLPVEE